MIDSTKYTKYVCQHRVFDWLVHGTTTLDFMEQLNISKSALWHYASCQRWFLAKSFDKILEVVYARLRIWLGEGSRCLHILYIQHFRVRRPYPALILYI
jgi:hypothetical protein